MGFLAPSSYGGFRLKRDLLFCLLSQPKVVDHRVDEFLHES